MKKNWTKILLAVVFAVGAILVLVHLFTKPVDFDFMRDASLLGVMLGFMGLTAVMALRLIGMDKIADWILFATGILVTILVVLTMIEALGQTIPDGPGRDYAVYLRRMLYTLPGLVYLITLGIVPMVLGAKRLFGKEEPVQK